MKLWYKNGAKESMEKARELLLDRESFISNPSKVMAVQVRAEMLVQGYNGGVRILPALPKEWKTGEVKAVYSIIGDLIDAGYDILNPVQTTARQMDPATLKREFGKDITFWGGGCNTRRILNRATSKEVYEYTSISSFN